ncbi:hypothetical protein LSAT2_030003 [Lamellibrachia satsuma]|nr:hypothetical protein LSAT2_030003 [Lamellibrachia satsuma]
MLPNMVAALATTKLDMSLVLLAPPSDSEKWKIIQDVRHIYSSGYLMSWIGVLSWLLLQLSTDRYGGHSAHVH